MQRYRQLLATCDSLQHCRPYLALTSSRGVSSRDNSVEATIKGGISKVANLFENAVSPGGAWSPEKMPDLTGKQYLITGANSGIGFQAAQQLVQHNAAVTLASRNQADGQRAVAELLKLSPGAQVDFNHLDLESFRSIQQFADNFLTHNKRLDCLINNAAVFMPQHRKTPEGFEATLGVNYFGPFFLTHLLMDRLRASAPSRLVFVVSSLETIGDIKWDDLTGAKASSSDMTAYGTSKLMTIMANSEIVRRLQGSGVDSFLCQPGMTSTPVYDKTDKSQVMANVLDAAQKFMGQTEERGAVPTLYAATAPELSGKSGTYVGPYYVGPLVSNLFNTGTQQPLNRWAQDSAACTQLYDETVRIVHAANASLGSAATTSSL